MANGAVFQERFYCITKSIRACFQHVQDGKLHVLWSLVVETARKLVCQPQLRHRCSTHGDKFALNKQSGPKIQGGFNITGVNYNEVKRSIYIDYSVHVLTGNIAIGPLVRNLCQATVFSTSWIIKVCSNNILCVCCDT